MGKENHRNYYDTDKVYREACKRQEEEENKTSKWGIAFALVLVYIVGFANAKWHTKNSETEASPRTAEEIAQHYSEQRKKYLDSILESVFDCIKEGAERGQRGATCYIEDNKGYTLKELKRLNYKIIVQKPEDKWSPERYWIEWTK